MIAMQNIKKRSYKFKILGVAFSLLIGLGFLMPASAFAAEIIGRADLSETNTVLFDSASPAVVPIAAYKEFPAYNLEYIREDGIFTVKRTQIGTQKRRVAAGSGFFISSDGYLITNKHVAFDPSLEYRVQSDKGELAAKVIYRDQKHDLAVLKVKGQNFPTLKLGNSARIRIGDDIVGIGNALGKYADSVSIGNIISLRQKVIVLGIGTRDEYRGLIQTSAKLYPGDSGGPLLNKEGNVIGINTATTIGTEGSSSGFSIPINIAKLALRKAGLKL